MKLRGESDSHPSWSNHHKLEFNSNRNILSKKKKKKTLIEIVCLGTPHTENRRVATLPNFEVPPRLIITITDLTVLGFHHQSWFQSYIKPLISMDNLWSPSKDPSITNRDRPRWGPGPPFGTIFFYFICIVIIYFFYVIGTFKNLRRSFFSIRLTSLTKLATIQSKNLTKTIKRFTIVIVY